MKKGGYDHASIEKKWQKKWGTNAHKTPDTKKGAKNFYLLVEFPYPSGNLHVGHWYAFAVPDIFARYMRMKGKNVLYPIGFDAFGLPAENAALKRGLNPRKWTEGNIAYMRKQLASMGASFDWSREVVTCDPAYYRWTQWLFLQLYKRGLVYRKESAVNWCPSCKTVLANEQVTHSTSSSPEGRGSLRAGQEGKCERCGTAVEQRHMAQWHIRITDYAERLLSDLEPLDWPEEIKAAQRNWIGKSNGSLIKFSIFNFQFSNKKEKISEIEVFTTRPDTLFGVSFIALSPQHPLAKETKNIKAVNPANGEEVPVFVADYVMDEYGTGAVMGVPAHDERDAKFAKEHGLPIPEASFATETQLQGIVVKTTKYKLRDWTVSRQRYWGVPIPIIHCTQCGYQPVRERDLPVQLPDIKDYQPMGDGKSPLAKAEKWKRVRCPSCGAWGERETDTLDTFVDSSWYFLRYTDPKNKKVFASPAKIKNWMPVDFYSGGAEHTTMHLLYSRFWHKALFNAKMFAEKEPYLRRMNRGLILGPDGQKMSKSRGNVIDPDAAVAQLGADTVRMYLAFIGPYNETGSYPWNPEGAVGVRRFLERVWKMGQNMCVENAKRTRKLRIASEPISEWVKRTKFSGCAELLNQTIKKVGEAIENFKMNTGVSALMILLNEFEKQDVIDRKHYEIFLRLLAPFAPHLAEELWSRLGYKTSIHKERWPTYNPKEAEGGQVTIVVQINGRVRDSFVAERGIGEMEAYATAAALPSVARHLTGTNISKRIYISNRLINFVTE